MTTTIPAFTTAFTPPAECTSQTWFWNDTATYVVSGVTDTWRYWSVGATDSSKCFPTGWNSATDMYFSPGHCPVGYTIACSNALQVDEMAATCCPTGYSCQTSPTWFWEHTNPCTRSTWNNAVVSYLYVGLDKAVQTSMTGLYMGLNAKAVSIRYNPNQPISTAPATITMPSSSSSPTSSSGGDKSNGISGGAVAGAVIGALIGSLLAFGLIYLLLHARRRSKKAKSLDPKHQSTMSTQSMRTMPVQQYYSPEKMVGNSPVPPQINFREAGGGDVYEIGPGKPFEGNPPSFVNEVPGDRTNLPLNNQVHTHNHGPIAPDLY